MTAPTDTERFWDDEAEGYDAAHDRDTSSSNPLRIRMGVVMRLLGPHPRSVLDCGMGPGRLLLELQRLGWEIAGIDVSGEMVALARDRLQTGPDRLLQGSIESLPFESESFDAAVATGVLEYVEDVPRALAEVERVLRPGGLFVISTPNTRAFATLWRHRVVYPSVRTIKSRLRFGRPLPLRRPGQLSLSRLDELLAAAGLEVERVEYIVLAPVLLHSLSPSLAMRVAKQLETLGPVFGAQVVTVARKPGSVDSEVPDQADETRAAI